MNKHLFMLAICGILGACNNSQSKKSEAVEIPQQENQILEKSIESIEEQIENSEKEIEKAKTEIDNLLENI